MRFLTSNRKILLFALFGAVIFVVAVIGTYYSLTEPFPGLNDFMSRWEGSRSFWQEGLNPYGEEASLNIQRAIYGRPAGELEDPGYFAYPFYTNFLLLPIVNTSYAWASAIWMVLLEACLIGALVLLLNHFQWQPSPILLGILILWTLVSYFPARGLLLGQPGLLVYFLEVLAIWALARKADRIAGVALAISTIKPQMGYLIVPFLLLWGLREQRWQFIGSFVIVFGLAMLASFAIEPTWMNDWLSQVGRYTSYTQIGGPVWVVSNWLWLGIDPETGLWAINGGYGNIIETTLAVILYGYMLWTWYEVLIQRKTERLMWTIVMTLTITHLVAPRTATPHYVIFIIPLIFYLQQLVRPKIKRGSLYAILLLVVLFVQQWLHFLLTVDGEFEHPSLYPPTAFLVFFVLLFTRKLWWNNPKDRFQVTSEDAS